MKLRQMHKLWQRYWKKDLIKWKKVLDIYMEML